MKKVLFLLMIPVLCLGSRTIGFPIIGTFAIFDSENYSSNSAAESAELVSKTLDCSGANIVLLYFDHYFAGSNGQFNISGV
mgnify:CR=1 FL=1|jgi:hypothetical protein|tara:strand:+ start:4518 stop:4760 length:243 start_codon:yes stop_codon:yes gene_type:complete